MRNPRLGGFARILNLRCVIVLISAVSCNANSPLDFNSVRIEPPTHPRKCHLFFGNSIYVNPQSTPVEPTLSACCHYPPLNDHQNPRFGRKVNSPFLPNEPPSLHHNRILPHQSQQ